MTAAASIVGSRRAAGGSGAASPSRHALHRFTLDRLTASAARLWGDRLAMRETRSVEAPAAAFTCADLDAEVRRMGSVLTHLGLDAGDRVVICGGTGLAPVVMLLAALQAGLDACLASPNLEPSQIALAANRIRAAAILADAGPHARLAGDALLSIAGEVPCMRLLCTCGGAVDGAAPLDAAAWAQDEVPAPEPRPASGTVITLARRPDGVEPVFHRQPTLIAAALDLIGRVRVGANTPILSTITPTTFAGLVAGPVAALLSGALLDLHPPFHAEAFLKALDACAPAHLLAPASIAPDLDRAGLIASSYLRSLILLVRQPADSDGLPGAASGGVPVFDLHALGERAAAAERRREGETIAPVGREPHVILVDASEVLAFEARKAATGDIEMRGAAVTGGEDWSSI